MDCYLQKYTTHQFTYFIYYLFQDKFKNPKMMKIQFEFKATQETRLI